MEHPGPNPYLFIVGCARSGTTLLQRIVDAHPLIAIIHEMHWVTSYFRQKGVRKAEDLVTPELARGLLDNRRFDRLRISREDFETLSACGESVPYAGFLSSIFDLYGRVENKPLVGNKTPSYVRRILTLHRLWPHAKFVHIIRDGRDVYLSMANWRKADATAGRYVAWREDPVSTTALWWERKVLLGLEGGKSVGSDLYHELSYESLITLPRETCTALCTFLGLPYDEAMLRFDEGRARMDPVDPEHPWNPITPHMRDWRTQMPVEAVKRFEAVAGDLLDELGYERRFPRPSTPALDHAARIRSLLVADLYARGDRLPERWETA